MATRVLHIWMLLLSVVHLNAQEVYPLDTLYPVHDLDPFLQVLADPDGRLEAERVIRDTTLEFLPRSHYPRLLEVGTVYWGKVVIRANGDLRGWVLHLEDRWFKNVSWIKSNGKADVYALSGGEVLFHKKTGADYPRSEREHPDRWILNRVSLDIPPREVVTLFIRIESNSFGVPPYFHASIRRPGFQHYHPLFDFNTSFHIFLFGVTFIIFLYHFLQFVYLRQAIYFWFSLWVGLCALTQAMAVGLDTELLLGHVPALRFPAWIIIPNSMLFSFWLFGRSFVQSKEKYPRLDKFMVALPLSMVFLILLTLILAQSDQTTVYITKVGFHYKFIILYSVLGVILAFILAFKRDLLARYFGIGAIIGTSFALLGGLWSDRLIRLSFDPYTWGIFLQTIAYSFGIAFRQRQLLLRSQAEQLEAEKSRFEVERIRDLDEIKSKFFANISHEFRTPLTLISGLIQQARPSAASDGNGQTNFSLDTNAFAVIQKNTRRLESLVDQLLDLSRLENGQVHLQLSQGGLIHFIRSVVFSFESLAERSNISLNTSFPAEIEAAFYDKDKLEKILSNLLSNAFKYTPSGGAVTVTLQYDDHHFTVEISDTGKGIDQEHVKHIFDRFYRVEGTEEKGSGIGLALTKELVDLHRGQLSVDSSKGQGTSFRVRLPYTLDDLPAALSKTEQPQRLLLSEDQPLPERPAEAPGHRPADADELPVVLVVEDNADLRDFITGILQGDYQVLTARDGLQGERMAFEHIPDLVITDVMMPKKDGYDLCHTLKSNVKTSHIPILMLTARAGQANKMEGLTQGADAYLTKPFDPRELLVRTKNMIEARQRMWTHFQSLDLLLIEDLDVISADDAFLQEVIRSIRANLDNEQLSVEDLARAVGFSRSQLHRKLKALTDRSANQLVVEIRLNEARRMLENKVGSVSEVAYSVGYSNMSYFTRSFKEKFGLLPSKV